MNDVVLVGRSSSHFTRVARLFALELGVSTSFRPVYDLQALGADNYADNPALKVPVLVLPEGPLFGTENICRELRRRATRPGKVLLRGEIEGRLLQNCEELTLHCMTNEVSLILAKLAGDPRLAPPKVRASLENSLAYLDEHVGRATEALPKDRALSFFEVSLYCLVTHLPFREVMDVTPYAKLADFCEAFGERASAQATHYHFDAKT